MSDTLTDQSQGIAHHTSEWDCMTIITCGPIFSKIENGGNYDSL